MLPDLLASSTSRPDTQETAAYAASQPLFDVLRGAISRLDEQKAHLTGAKDTVQHIHVKVPQEHIENNGKLPNDYRESLVTAWKVTTESYVRIFEQLCALTGPDWAAGKEADDSYPGFQALLFTAEESRTVAFQIDAQKTKAKDTTESGGSESESSASSKKATPKKGQQTPVEVASTKRVAASEPSPSQIVPRPAKKQRTTASETSNTPTEKATNETNEQRALNTVQRLKPKQVRKERKRRIQQHRDQQEQQQAATAPPATVPPPESTNTIAQAQYEDVSAEVDARLRAKEEQKKAKKQAKKRKRDSHGSHILEAEPGEEVEAAEVRAKILAQKPAKKRSKSENGEGVRVDEEKKVPAKGKGKRGLQDDNAQAQATSEGARRSKRKKT